MYRLILIILLICGNNANAETCNELFKKHNSKETGLGITTMAYQYFCAEEFSILIDEWKTNYFLESSFSHDPAMFKDLGIQITQECSKQCGNKNSDCAKNIGSFYISQIKNGIKSKNIITKKLCLKLQK